MKIIQDRKTCFQTSPQPAVWPTLGWIFFLPFGMYNLDDVIYMTIKFEDNRFSRKNLRLNLGCDSNNDHLQQKEGKIKYLPPTCSFTDFGLEFFSCCLVCTTLMRYVTTKFEDNWFNRKKFRPILRCDSNNNNLQMCKQLMMMDTPTNKQWLKHKQIHPLPNMLLTAVNSIT